MFPRTLIGFGASSLAGVGDPEGGGFWGRIRNWHESKSLKNTVFNLGIPGQTTSEMIERFQSEVSLRRPHLIVIAPGLNDTRRVGSSDARLTVSKEQFSQNIHALIDLSQAVCDVVFVSAYPIDETRTQPLAYWTKEFYYSLTDATEYASIMKAVCGERKIPYLDIFNDWLQTDYRPWLAEDGLHANAVGHTKIYEQLKHFLEKLYQA